MTESSPTNGEWRELYEAVVRVKEISPWEWMTEADVFGVQNPDTGELGFVSVMGMLGEYYAVGLYLGPEALYDFWGLEEIGPTLDPEGLLEIPQLQASFEDRNDLHNRDYKTIKELGFKFRGRQAWPMFRSYRPGFAPWFLEAGEARFLTHALNQLVDVSPRFREDSSLLEGPTDESYLVRVPREEDGALVWEDRTMDVPPPEPSPIEIEVDARALQGLGQLSLSESRVEMDFFMLPAPVKGGGDRPYFPYMLLGVESQSGVILVNEMLTADPSLEAMWGSIPENVVRQLARVELLPEKITAGSGLLAVLLEPLAESLGFELEQSQDLPTLYPVKEYLLQTIG